MDESIKRIDKLEEKFDVVDKKMDRLLFILDDDKGTSQKGLVGQFKESEKNQKQFEERVEKFISDYNTAQKIKDAKAGLLGAIAGGIVSGVTIFFKLFNSQS